MSEPDELYEVTIWDWQGGVVKRVRDATFDEAEELRELYGEDEGYSVIVEMV